MRLKLSLMPPLPSIFPPLPRMLICPSELISIDSSTSSNSHPGLGARLIEYVADDCEQIADLSFQLVGADLHPLGQAFADRLHGAGSEAAADILGAAATFDNFNRFAGLDFGDKPQPRLLVRHEIHPFA